VEDAAQGTASHAAALIGVGVPLIAFKTELIPGLGLFGIVFGLWYAGIA
jgi:hypothetical protein